MSTLDQLKELLDKLEDKREVTWVADRRDVLPNFADVPDAKHAGGKRRRQVLDDDATASASGEPQGPVYVFAFTWNRWDDAAGRPYSPTESEFGKLFVQLRTALVALGAKYIFQLERGAEGRLHYQGYIHLAKGVKQRPASVAKHLAEAGCFGVHLSACSAAGKEALKAYCMKDDTRIAGPWSDKDAQPMSVAQMDKLKLIHRQVLYPYQQQISAAISTDADDRRVNWVYDPLGATGKSSFCKLMHALGKALTLQYADHKDIMYVVQTFGARGAYLLDLTRTKPAQVSAQDTYTALEGLKTGLIQSTKYQPKVTLQPPAHVWVFANVPPTMSCLSPDRWKVWQLTPANQLVPFNSVEYKAFMLEKEFEIALEAARKVKRQKLIDDRVKAALAADDDV